MAKHWNLEVQTAVEQALLAHRASLQPASISVITDDNRRQWPAIQRRRGDVRLCNETHGAFKSPSSTSPGCHIQQTHAAPDNPPPHILPILSYNKNSLLNSVGILNLNYEAENDNVNQHTLPIIKTTMKMLSKSAMFDIIIGKASSFDIGSNQRQLWCVFDMNGESLLVSETIILCVNTVLMLSIMKRMQHTGLSSRVLSNNEWYKAQHSSHIATRQIHLHRTFHYNIDSCRGVSLYFLRRPIDSKAWCCSEQQSSTYRGSRLPLWGNGSRSHLVMWRGVHLMWRQSARWRTPTHAD